MRFFGNDLSETQFAFDNLLITAGGEDDLELILISPPMAGDCGTYTASETVGILIKNNTCRDVTNVPLEFDISGAGTTNWTGNVPGPILGNSIYYYTLPVTFDMSATGTYTLSAIISSNLSGLGNDYLNDTFSFNDTVIETRFSNSPISTYP